MPRSIATTRTASGNRFLARNLTGCLGFNGTSSFVEFGVGNFIFERTDTFSCFAWVFIQSLGAGASGHIFGKRSNLGTTRGWQMRYDANLNKFVVVLSNDTAGGNVINVSSSKAIPIGTWVHLGFTYSGSSAASGITMYMNGVSMSNIVNNDTLSATIASISTPTFGSRNKLDQFFKGFITETVVTNSIMSSTEITNLCYKGILPASLYAVYNFTEGSGTSLADSSGNSRTGTITSGTWATSGPFAIRTASVTRTQIS